MNMNDDSLVLNIALPQSRPSSLNKASPLSGKASSRSQKNLERREKNKQDRVFEKKNFRKETEKGPFGKKANGLNRSSKKIQKVKSKKSSSRVNEEYIEPQNVETLLEIDEKKDESTDLFVGNTFKDIPNLNERLVSTLETHGFATMTKIQKESIPVLMKNKNCLIKSETGSGKTLAYLVIIRKP